MTNLLVARAKEKFTHDLLIVKLTIFFPIQFELLTLSRRALRYISITLSRDFKQANPAYKVNSEHD